VRRTPWVRCATVRPTAAVLATLALLALPACGDDGGSVADERADQVRAAAEKAGLPDDVADVLALAATGALATFQVAYAGTEGARLVVSQAPPDHRVDVITAGVVESRVLRDGTAYRCEREADALRCTRAAGALERPGTFTDYALDAFTEQLADSRGALDLTVEDREIAATDATCLVTTPKAGTPLDGAALSTDTLCLSDEGAQLLLDAGGERLVADSYSTDVPEGTFEVEHVG
jgi:hypothetical protein